MNATDRLRRCGQLETAELLRTVFGARLTAFRDADGTLGRPELLAEFDGLKANPPTIKTTYRGKAR